MILELERGHFIDLSKVLELDDDPENGEAFLVLPAPALDDDGPHGVAVTGEARRLALGYFRHQARTNLLRLQAMADSLDEEPAELEIFTSPIAQLRQVVEGQRRAA